ncbi:unnamed protein product [Chrysoparadoxa australica]
MHIRKAAEGLLQGVATLPLLRATSAFAFRPPQALLAKQHWPVQAKLLGGSSQPHRVVSLRESAVEEASDTGDIAQAEERIDWQAQWYPIALSRFTDKEAPYPMTVLGTPLSIWWDHVEERWCAVEDRCPHRAAPLSEGRVTSKGEIQCPYHGWSFKSGGRCTEIPQDTSLEPGPRACAVAYPCQEKQGLIWVWMVPMGQSPLPSSTLPLMDAIDDPRATSNDFTRDVPMDWVTLVENLMDVSHVPFTHHNTVSTRAKAAKLSYKAVEPVTKDGFLLEQIPEEGSDLTTSDGSKKPGMQSRKTFYKAPLLLYHSTNSSTVQTYTVAYCVPMAPGKARIIARFPFIIKGKGLRSQIFKLTFKVMPTWILHFGMNTVIDDDNIFLHGMERVYVRKTGSLKNWGDKSASYLAASSDYGIALYRKWLRSFGGDGPFDDPVKETLPTATRDELLDRQHSHTNHCKPCRDAQVNGML